MKDKIRWGILSTAKIGRTQVIPAIQQSKFGAVTAIASSDINKARQTAADLNIATAYGSYEELLADSNIDAVYVPLPNQLHIDFTLKALAAGKHVLCEKPIGLNAADAQRLTEGAQQYPHLKVMEAFMYRFHPQWQKVKNLIDNGTLGDIKVVQSFFSYYNVDAGNIRNMAGGGGLMDIGCYCISFPRFIFNAEPKRVVGLINIDPNFGVDNLTSGLLDFGSSKQATFTCSTQLEPFQRVNILGSKGRLEVEIPVNAPNDAPCRLFLQRERIMEEIIIPTTNQYAKQVDEFARAIINDTEVPTSLTDALQNMLVIDALVESGKTGEWVTL